MLVVTIISFILFHFSCFVRDGEAGDVVAVVAEVEALAAAEDNHADIELSTAAFTRIRLFELILLFVGTFLQSLHNRGFVGLTFGDGFVGVRGLDRLIGFGFGSNAFLHVFDGLYVLCRSDDEGLRHTRYKVFVSGPVGEMGFFVMFEDSVGVKRQFGTAFPAIIGHFFHGIQ